MIQLMSHSLTACLVWLFFFFCISCVFSRMRCLQWVLRTKSHVALCTMSHWMSPQMWFESFWNIDLSLHPLNEVSWFIELAGDRWKILHSKIWLRCTIGICHPPPLAIFFLNFFYSWDDMHVLYFWKALGTGMLEMMFPGVNSPTSGWPYPPW